MRDLIKKGFTAVLFVSLILSYLLFLDVQGWVTVNDVRLPLPVFKTESLAYKSPVDSLSEARLRTRTSLHLDAYRASLIASRRQEQIDKVEAFFAQYGSPLVGYGHIFVDKSEECGGDYRVLVGIAGSESGLGRINYKLYNPFGYLDGVQYPDQKTALEILSCRVSEQHISKCGTDLYCLARRYAGSSDDLDHFVNKVYWFMRQVS